MLIWLISAAVSHLSGVTRATVAMCKPRIPGSPGPGRESCSSCGDCHASSLALFCPQLMNHDWLVLLRFLSRIAGRSPLPCGQVWHPRNYEFRCHDPLAQASAREVWVRCHESHRHRLPAIHPWAGRIRCTPGTGTATESHVAARHQKKDIRVGALLRRLLARSCSPTRRVENKAERNQQVSQQQWGLQFTGCFATATPR